LVVEDEDRRPREVCGHEGGAFERGVALRVQHFETDIELRDRVPLGTGAGLPEADVGAAAVAAGKAECRGHGGIQKNFAERVAVPVTATASTDNCGELVEPLQWFTLASWRRGPRANSTKGNSSSDPPTRGAPIPSP
jgi:hypothetical protein